MKVDVWAIICDSHIPYESRALDFIIDILETIQPTGLVINGDFADFYSLSQHGPRHPEVKETLWHEVETCKRYRKKIEQVLPHSQLIFCEGNHEYRLSRWLEKYCPALFDFISITDMLELDAGRWKFVQYGPRQLYKIPYSNIDYYVCHEPPRQGEHSAKRAIDFAKCSFSFGHIHRKAMETSTNLVGNVFTASCPGWLGDTSKAPEVFNYLKNVQNWSLGFQLLVVERETGSFFENIIEIKQTPDGRLICHALGKTFKK